MPGYVLASVNHAVAGVTGLGVAAAVALMLFLLVAGAIAILRGWRPPALLIAALLGIVALFTSIGLGRAQLPVLPPRYEISVSGFCAIITSNTPTTKSCPRCLRAKAMPYYHP